MLLSDFFDINNDEISALLFTKHHQYVIITLTLTFSERMKIMAVTYNKLRHLLIDRNMMKKDLQELAGLTNHIMMKIRTDQDITTETIEKICRALNCEMTDIMEFYDEDKK